MNVKEARKLVCDQIRGAIEQDLKNSESLMKEVFEQCLSKADLGLVYAEMIAICQMLEARSES